MIRARVAVADRRARGVRGARRDLHRARGEGRLAQPDADTGAHDRSPVWSPDGAQLAWLSDASGEYQLMIGEQTGVDEAARDRAAGDGVLLEPAWSPDGKQLLLEDNHLNLWTIDVASGDRRRRSTPTPTTIRAAGSTRCGRRTRGGSRTRRVSTSHLRAIFLYSIADGKRASGHRRTVGRDLAGVRRRRQVSVLPGEHELRPAHRLARDELRRPARRRARSISRC